MSKRLKNNSDFLCVLSKCKPKVRSAILEHADNDLVKTLSECALNTISGKIPISPAHKKKLSRHRNTLRQLSHKRVSLKKKKGILNQRGGNLLRLLLPPVVAVLKHFIDNR